MTRDTCELCRELRDPRLHEAHGERNTLPAMTEPGGTRRTGLGRVAVAGEALVDELPARNAASGDPRLELRPGGSPYNVAIGLARLGIPVSFHGAVGSDDEGQLLRDHAERNGVDLSHLGVDATPTMRA